MSDTMRRIRSYKNGTDIRGSSRKFQGKMLKHLVQSSSRTNARKNKEDS